MTIQASRLKCCGTPLAKGMLYSKYAVPLQLWQDLLAQYSRDC
jgi:hypothetical protein